MSQIKVLFNNKQANRKPGAHVPNLLILYSLQFEIFLVSSRVNRKTLHEVFKPTGI